jgi:hypothetical protein
MIGSNSDFTISVGTLRTGYPHVQASSQCNGSRLPAGDSFGAATCLRGSSSRLLAWGSSGTATWHLGSNTHHLAHGSSGATTCPGDGFCRPQANKQIPPGDQAILISIRARMRVSSKTLRDKGCSARSQGVQ